MAALGGSKDVAEVLLEAGASKGLIFDCLSFTEGLITCLSTVESEAPASSNTSVTLLGFVKKRLFYVMMTTELFVKYFHNIKLC
jgi:hypothetical protein